MKSAGQYHSLKTADLADGVALSATLAKEITRNISIGLPSIPKPGGTNYASPASIPQELIASILFVAISAANDGWSK